MKNFIKETTEKDIEHIFKELENKRINNSVLDSNPDFRPYRSMSYCLIDTFSNYTYTNKIDKDNEFIKMFVKKLTYEIKALHELMELHKDYYERFKCLNDAFIKLTKLFNNMPYSYDKKKEKMKINCQIDKTSIDNIRNQLNSFSSHNGFNHAIVKLEVLVTDGDKENENTFSINISPRVDYIVPFISEDLAHKYSKELISVNELVINFPINSHGRIICSIDDIKNVINIIKDSHIDGKFNFDTYVSYHNFMIILAYRLRLYNDAQLDEYTLKTFGLKDKNKYKEIIKTICSEYEFEFEI